MPEINKTRALIVSKKDQGDSSLILTFYTQLYGKIEGILKGAKSTRSKTGNSADVLNFVEIVFYNKENRGIQLVKSIDLIKFYPHLKNDLDSVKYASSLAETLGKLIPENEVSDKLFITVTRFMDILEEKKTEPAELFARFLFFFLKESGYELTINECSGCGKNLVKENSYFLNFENGMLCNDCGKDSLYHTKVDQELFNTMVCLKTKNNGFILNGRRVEQVIKILEKYIMYHNPMFKGFLSLRIL